MDRETWEALPLGTNVLVTFHTGQTYTTIRVPEGGASAGHGFGLYGGEYWSKILDWDVTDLEVIFTPTHKEN